MKTGNTRNFIRIMGLLGLFAISACKSSGESQSEDPFAAINFNLYDQDLGKRIEAYHSANTPGSETKKGTPALYIDFSSGINKAFSDPAIKSMMSACFNTVLTQQFEVYKLGSNKISLLNVANTTELGQQVSDPKQYADIWAPLQATVEKIVAGNSDALLITDFEEWQKNIEVTNTAFLKIPFSRWLEKGNSIHFFIADYQEGKVNKHLYFTIFSYGRSDAGSLISKLESKLSPSTTRFDLSNSTYQLSTAYPSEKSGGIFYDETAKSEKAKNILDLKEGYINGLKNGQDFEFYPLGLDWKNIDQLHHTYAAQNQFNDFFRKLFIDLNNEDSYTFGNFKVKVSDVTADFENFAKAEEAKKHQPKLSKGSNGEAKFSDQEKDAIALSCYNADGKLKEKWIYKAQASNLLNEVFTLNQTLFANTRASNPKHVEFGVSFDPKFSIANIPNPDGLIKVEILPSTVTPNLQGAKMTKFEWINSKNAPNTALSESIKNTLQELKPVDKVVYSYYIKTKQ
ncbi:hypothetical protein [uncultured Pedobacter sp.]|uniref:hypothetical protein n=1 Tax=uncultured Pedobacter sp. TaxID=246139 RepID=UPI0025E79312|nr:hypothetical protein [uncultured Pedobacter sp.]